MVNDCILAMTAAEIRANSTLPPKIGWLGCHFSPCGTGLSNLPDSLPPGAMLILDDLVPFHGHDPERIVDQLRAVMEKHKCGSLLLDFQRPGEPETAALARAVSDALPCPVGVSEMYAGEPAHPVFLPPVPPDIPAAEYLKPWDDREVWLDMAPGGTAITLTGDGAIATFLPAYEIPAGSIHRDTALHCHYTIQPEGDRVQFLLYRTAEDLEALQEEARALGVGKFIGLWQELRGLCSDGLDDKL